MIVTTTNSVQGAEIAEYISIVSGETILGAHVFKDLFAGLRDFFGGRSKAYEESLQEARETAMEEMQERAKNMGATAIVGVDFDYESISNGGSSMLMVTCSGTAVKTR